MSCGCHYGAVKVRRVFQEEILSIGLLAIFGLLALALVGAAIAQIALGPLGSKPAPTVVYWLFGLLFGIIAFSFHKLVVRIDRSGITARYGPFVRQLKWRDIEGIETDESGAFYGYGVRLARYRGRSAWVFNVIRATHVAAVTREGGPISLIFSSRRPEEAMAVAEQYLRPE